MSLTTPKVSASTDVAGSATWDISGHEDWTFDVELGGGTYGAVPTVGLSYYIETHPGAGFSPITPDVEEVSPGRRRVEFRGVQGERLSIAWYGLTVASGSPTITIRDRSR